MSPGLKFLIGLLAVLLMGWGYHGPLVGNGAATIDRLEQAARAVIAKSEVPGVQVEMGRDPLSRVATLSGPANKFQREGMGRFPGLNDRISEIEGISRFQWADEGGGGTGIPLLVETLLLLTLGYFAGLGLAWLFFGRAKKESYL